MLRKTLLAGAVTAITLAGGQAADAQVRLIGMTGNQSQGVWEGIAQEALYEINIETATSSLIAPLGFAYDSQAIGFNPADGNLYRTGGIDAYRCGTLGHYSFNDTQYMEKMVAADLALGTPVETTAIFNADPAQAPKPAPRPSWVYPQEIRVSTLDPCDEPDVEDTNDEYHSLRGLAWSSEREIFFGSDEEGIFTMTPDGTSKFVGIPREDFRQVKGIVIVEVDGQEKLFVGTKQQTGTDPFFGSELIEVNMDTGEEVSSVTLIDPILNTIGARGVLGLSVHPESGVLYAVTHSGEFENHDDHPELRELITVDPVTGETALVGVLNANFSSIAFVYPTEVEPGQIGDTNGDGKVTIEDLNNVRNNFGGAGLGDTVGSDDGNVTIEDLNNVRNNFGAGVVVGANAVPEPSTALLALCGLAAIGYRFRRK
jgi:hypothetical protein